MELQKGQKLKLTDLTSAQHITIRVAMHMNRGETDITCFGVDENGKLSDDRYFIFYNQTSAPDGSITMQSDGAATSFSIDLSRLPSHIKKLVVTAATDNATMQEVADGQLTLSGSGNAANYVFSGNTFAQEKAIILCELYCKSDIWRYSVVANGFNGGLSALLAHFGGQETTSPQPNPAPQPKPVPMPNPAPKPNPAPAPAPQPKVNLSKISLKSSGESHKINLTKNSEQIHVNLNWNTGRRGLFGFARSIDLDLACMFRLKDGQQGVIQALGNSFGRADAPPFILLDQDDRTGNSANGENMYFKRPELIEFAVIFAYIYEGAANWRNTDAKVVLSQANAPDIEVQINSSSSNDRFCVFASLSGSHGQLEVKREDRFFAGHREVDDFYHFGFRWKAGHK